MNSQASSKVQLKNETHQYLRAKYHDGYNIYVKKPKRACRNTVSNYEDSSSKEVKSNPKTFFTYAKSKLNYASSIPDQSYKIIQDQCNTRWEQNYHIKRMQSYHI